MATANFEDLVESRFAEDLKAAAAPAITDTELTQAYKFFGAKKGKAAGKTDAQLYKRATTDILSWWKKAKKEGYYNETKGAGKPVGSTGKKPKKATLPKFNQGFMSAARRQYGISQPVPTWAKRNQERFETWLNIQLRRRGLMR